MTYVTTHDEGNTLKNEPSTGDRECNCGSWLEHWKKYTKSSNVPDCIVDGCRHAATVGAHVEFTKVNDYKLKSYIAPMCDSHNKDHNLIFKSKPNYRLAVGNKNATCGK